MYRNITILFYETHRSSQIPLLITDKEWHNAYEYISKALLKAQLPNTITHLGAIYISIANVSISSDSVFAQALDSRWLIWSIKSLRAWLIHEYFYILFNWQLYYRILAYARCFLFKWVSPSSLKNWLFVRYLVS